MAFSVHPPGMCWEHVLPCGQSLASALLTALPKHSGHGGKEGHCHGGTSHGGTPFLTFFCIQKKTLHSSGFDGCFWSDVFFFPGFPPHMCFCECISLCVYDIHFASVTYCRNTCFYTSHILTLWWYLTGHSDRCSAAVPSWFLNAAGSDWDLQTERLKDLDRFFNGDGYPICWGSMWFYLGTGQIWKLGTPQK